MALILQHQTPAQFATRFRERYRNSSREETIRLATRLLDWIDAGDMTDVQARNAFGLTVAQWAPVKARMTTQRTNYAALRAVVGE